MDFSFDRSFDGSTDIWHKIMDQLKELKEWQKMQEEVVRKRQSKQIESLSEQNEKLINLSNDDNHINASTDDCPSKQCNQMTETSFDINSNYSDNDSIQETMTKEECHQNIDNKVFSNNNSYLENSPVVPGINGKDVKTFEELLNAKLNDKNVDLMANNDIKPKKPFLRKGEGIKRFEGNKSQTNSSTKDNKNSEGNRVSKKTRPKSWIKPNYSVKQLANKNKTNKSEENETKPKKFIRKVIPMTTKFEKIDNKSIKISRNTPTVIIDGLNESESELFDYLRQIYGNISIEDSIDDEFKNKDINELKELLKKIETKREIIQKQFSSKSPENEPNFCDVSQQFVTKTKPNYKKKVRWSHTQTLSDDECEEKSDTDLVEPKAGPYSSKLKQQIHELEDQLLRLKTIKKDKPIDSSFATNNENIEPINEELFKLRQQIEKLNKRIINIESKAYDLSSNQLKDISNRKTNSNCFVRTNPKTFPKTIRSPSTGPNVLVNEVSKDTIIDFPNGDKMTVSKDNTILYSFTNGTTQTTYADGLKITNFPNGQTERVDRYGVKRIIYSNGLQRIINTDSSEEVIMTDGTVWRIHSDGSEVLEFPNGDREIRTNKYKRREYRSGNIKTLYSDGTEETRYINGRLRIKDKFGNLMVDSMAKHLDQHI